jgi:hypothetical protein
VPVVLPLLLSPLAKTAAASRSYCLPSPLSPYCPPKDPSFPNVMHGPPSCHSSTLLGISIILISLSVPIRIVTTLINLMIKSLSLGSENVESSSGSGEWMYRWKGIGGGSAPCDMNIIGGDGRRSVASAPGVSEPLLTAL